MIERIIYSMFVEAFEVYETGIINYHQKKLFQKFLDNEIGTDYDINKEDENLYYLVIFELTLDEVQKIREFELNL